MIQIPRRRFLKIVLSAAAGAAAIGFVAVRFPYAALRERYYRLSTDTSPGPLGAGALRTLMAAAEALIGASFEHKHYEVFLSWRAANIPGHRGVYERLAAMLDRLAMAAGRKPFADLDIEARRRIVDALSRLREHRLHELWAAVFNRDRLLFGRHITQPVLALYARTDAWIHLGYDAWPGRARGVERYLQSSGSGAAFGTRGRKS
jgi:hypothetical protein